MNENESVEVPLQYVKFLPSFSVKKAFFPPFQKGSLYFWGSKILGRGVTYKYDREFFPRTYTKSGDSPITCCLDFSNVQPGDLIEVKELKSLYPESFRAIVADVSDDGVYLQMLNGKELESAFYAKCGGQKYIQNKKSVVKYIHKKKKKKKGSFSNWGTKEYCKGRINIYK